MPKYLLRKLFAGVIVFLTVTSVTFFLFNIRGGTVIARNLLPTSADDAQVQRLAESLGLLRPFWVQYGEWLGNLLTGDLGRAYISRQPVADSLATRLPVTASLIGLSILLTVLLGVPLGIWAARRGGAIDRALQVLSVFVQAIPGYWLALVLVIVFALSLHLLPATGFVPPSKSISGWLASIALPSIAIALGSVAFIAMQVRGGMIDAMQQEWVRTLRARGIASHSIVTRHALRSAAPPVLTILSLQIIGLLTGAVIVEQIFALPGLGTLALTAGQAGDVPVVLGVVVVLVTVIVIVNLLTDGLNAILNPKVRKA